MSSVSIVIPTIKGREDYLQQAVEGYMQTTPTDEREIIVIHDEINCGRAWNEGARRAKGDYLHFAADDLVPHRGWLRAAWIAMVKNLIPAPHILRPDGSTESCGVPGQPDTLYRDGQHVEFSAIPFIRRAWWDEYIAPVIDAHYYTDNWISFMAARNGIPSVVVRDYLFTHHRAQEGRGAGMGNEPSRMVFDRAIFEKARAEVERG